MGHQDPILPLQVGLKKSLQTLIRLCHILNLLLQLSTKLLAHLVQLLPLNTIKLIDKCKGARVVGGPMAMMSRFTSNLYDEVPLKTQPPNIPLRTHSVKYVLLRIK
jgi:hypothetical protein